MFVRIGESLMEHNRAFDSNSNSRILIGIAGSVTTNVNIEHFANTEHVYNRG